MQTPPLQLFSNWYAEAKAHADIADASAMSLATADKHGKPSVRMVLLKRFDESGFVFYTNLTSPKASDLEQNARAAVCFHWAPLARQVRVDGPVVPVSAEEADAYFATRPRLSQLGAWASRQSKPMGHRYALEAAVAWAVAQYGSGAVPRPPHWSGFRLVPEHMEFWREGAFRHHERVLYTRTADGWTNDLLYP
jgi:pyridoxamine 5'-phosphate oxidase